MQLFNFLDDIGLSIKEFLHGTIGAQCRLETAVDHFCLSADDGTLLTFIELSGSLQLFGDDEFNHAIISLSQSLNGYLKSRGHALQFVIMRDPNSVREEIDANFLPMVNTAQAMGIDIAGIMQGNAEKLASLTAAEHVFIVAWTYPYAMPGKTEKKAAKRKKAMKVPFDGQTMDISFLDLLLSLHRNFSNAVMSALDKGRLGARLIEVHEALRYVRKCICPESTTLSWRPILPGDRIRLHNRNNTQAASGGVGFPSLKKQLYPAPGETSEYDDNSISIGTMIHRPTTMEFGPENPQPFMELFRELLKQPFGWRISFHLSGNGLCGKLVPIEKGIAKILSVTNSENKMFVDSINELQELKKRNLALIQFEANFDTWVDRKNYPTEKAAVDALASQKDFMMAALQTWGGMETREVVGDPLLPFSASIPGLALKTSSAKPIAPFHEVLEMMPITRPASPWKRGPFLLRSIDGKLFPVSIFSDVQASSIEIGYGGLGSGKSFWINGINYAYIFAPGQDELPYLGIIDIGPSSSGLIELARYSLPPKSRKAVAGFKLVMDLEHAVNPFDTPLGCRKPYPSQMNWLVNLLSAICTPDNQKDPHEADVGIVRRCIEKAYEASGDKHQKKYVTNRDQDLDRIIPKLDIEMDDSTSWWEIVDALFEEGLTHEATLAQRHAVPLLRDIITYTRDPGIRAMYKDAGDERVDYVARKLSEALSQYPIFQVPTKFDLGEARIISLDLQEVAPRGGTAADRQTGIMYLLAWHLVAGKFFYAEEEADAIHVPNKPELTQRYKAMHKAMIKKLRTTPKRIVADEYHRANRTGPVISQLADNLETCTRESRKWMISVGVYSQKIEDMPEALRELATTHYVLGADSPEVQDKITKIYKLNTAGQSALGMLGKPDARGANCLAIFHTTSGMVQQLVTYTAGPHQIWAFNTTPENMNVRDELYRRLGPARTLDVLVELYPQGIKKYVDDKKFEFGNKGIRKDAVLDVVEEIERYAQAH